jgi:hypothetical protein
VEVAVAVQVAQAALVVQVLPSSVTQAHSVAQAAL